MHSRVFNVSSTIENMEGYLTEEEVYERMNGYCDYANNETNLLEDLKWLFGLFGDEVESKLIRHDASESDYDEEFYEVPYEVIKDFVVKFKTKKVESLKECMNGDMKKLIRFFEEGKCEDDVSYNIMYMIEKTINDRLSFYINYEYCFHTLDYAVIDVFDKLEEGKSLYFYQSFDYHY